MNNLCNSCSNFNKDLQICGKGKSTLSASLEGGCSAYTHNSGFRYTFKRKEYIGLVGSIQVNEVTFLLGPRKCGKTICLRQYAYEHPNAEYIDIKSIVDKTALVIQIQQSILSREDKVYLIDEVTYLNNPAEDIQQIVTCFDEVDSPTRIVFSGSQSVALEVWANRSFAGNAGIVRMDFIDYAEWLIYRNLNLSEESYFDFILNVEGFYRFTTCEDYLAGCLNETVISNSKSIEIIPLNECDKLSVDILMTVLYAILFSKHNHISYTQFVNRKRLEDDFRLYAEQDSLREYSVNLINKLEIKYDLFSSLDVGTLKQAIVFLYKCGLISIAKVTSSVDQYVDPLYVFINDYKPLNKQTLFMDYNFSIKYPMFYIAVIKSLGIPVDIVKNNRALLGSLVECHIKGLMSDRFCIEYHTETGKEIDCIDLNKRIAIESSVTDKHAFTTLLETELPRFTKILTTREKTDSIEDIHRFPYYKLLFELTK